MNRLANLIELGRVARKQIEDLNHKVKLHAWASPLSPTLAGACGTASLFLLDKAKKRRMRPRFVYGTFFRSDNGYADGHCWVEYAGHVIDITATQFISCDPVYVISLKKAKEIYTGAFYSSNSAEIIENIGSWSLYPKELQDLV